MTDVVAFTTYHVLLSSYVPKFLHSKFWKKTVMNQETVVSPVRTLAMPAEIQALSTDPHFNAAIENGIARITVLPRVLFVRQIVTPAYVTRTFTDGTLKCSIVAIVTFQSGLGVRRPAAVASAAAAAAPADEEQAAVVEGRVEGAAPPAPVGVAPAPPRPVLSLYNDFERNECEGEGDNFRLADYARFSQPSIFSDIEYLV